MKLALIRSGFVALLLVGFLAGVIAFPRPLFAYSYHVAGLTLHSDRSLNAAGTRDFLRDVKARLDHSMLGPDAEALTLYSAGGWRERLFFTHVQSAGGVVYVPLSRRHAFLSRIDTKGDRLIKNGTIIAPPRTASYYAVHELAHLRVAAMVGALRFHRMPVWVREGLADYVALGPMAPDTRKAIMAWNGPRLPLMQRYGAYPEFRAMVDFAINDLGWSKELLISTEMNETAMRNAMAADG